MGNFSGLANLALQATDKPSRAMKGNELKMTPIATFAVTETVLGWNAPGLFKWEKVQKELLAEQKACHVLVDDETWRVKEMDGLGEHINGFTFELDGKARARAFFPLSSPQICLIVWKEDVFRITSEGAYSQVFTEEAIELVRIKEGWKDSDRKQAIRHRIEVFSDQAGLHAAIAYGSVLGFLSPPSDYSRTSSAGITLGLLGFP